MIRKSQFNKKVAATDGFQPYGKICFNLYEAPQSGTYVSLKINKL